MMKNKITIHIGRNTETIFLKSGTSLLDGLTAHGFVLPASCGGFGKCGKCKVDARGSFDEPYGDFTKRETLLACEAYPCGDCSVWLTSAQAPTPEYRHHKVACDGDALGIALDVGTTGISAILCDMKSGEILAELSEKNSQCQYGADIMTRIGGDNALLSSVLREQLNSIIARLHSKKSQISYIVISANTALSHFIAGLPTDGLSRAPFTPQDMFGREYPADKLGIKCKNAGVYIAPSLAAFVGGDISAGILSVGLHRKRKLSLLLDIGTNGEMALGSSKGIFVTSAAAGPAFEGASLSCGMAAEPGAIYAFDSGSFKTIGGARPRGLCGSGAIDVAAELLRYGVITGGGTLLPPDEAPAMQSRLSVVDGEVRFNICDSVYLTASDVRELQLAKAAIRAAMHTLFEKNGISTGDIHALFLSGAFGTHIKKENAVALGIIPDELLLKCIPCGNTALDGAKIALLSRKYRTELSKIQKKCTVSELSGDPVFDEAFLNYIAM